MLTLLALLACKDGTTPTDDSAAPDDSAVDSEDSGGDDSGDDTGTPDARWDPVREAIDATLGRGYASGVSIAVWVDGEIVYAEGFGSAHPDRDVPVKPTTLFNIGSDTKKLAAITLLQQVAKERLSLTTPLSEALPQLILADDPDAMAQAQVSMLLDHTTSFVDDTNMGTENEDGQLGDYAYGDFANNAYFMAEPGVMWNYANPNFSRAPSARLFPARRMATASAAAAPELSEYEMERVLKIERNNAKLLSLGLISAQEARISNNKARGGFA
jgi:CubicO group peptidase (beta-lactamase class C family)